MSESTASIPASTVITGQELFPVRFQNGELGSVAIKLTPLSKIDKYLERMGDVAGLIDYVTGNEPGFADTLDTKSQFEVDERIRELHADFIERYLRRQEVAMKPLLERSRALSALTR